MSNWLIPLNIHQSFALRSVSANTSQLSSISSSIGALSQSLATLESASIEIAGSTSGILQLLQNREHRDAAIAGMRSVIFQHSKTCKSALQEDAFTGLIACRISENMMNQPWFNLDLFSSVSFDEMTKSSEIIDQCNEQIEEIRGKLAESELLAAESIVPLTTELEEVGNLLVALEEGALDTLQTHFYNFNDWMKVEKKRIPVFIFSVDFNGIIAKGQEELMKFTNPPKLFPYKGKKRIGVGRKADKFRKEVFGKYNLEQLTKKLVKKNISDVHKPSIQQKKNIKACNDALDRWTNDRPILIQKREELTQQINENLGGNMALEI